MSHADLDINRDVRRVMIRHWIDLGRLSFRSIRGRVSIRGSLQRIPGTSEELTAPIVNTMFADIGAIRGVTHVNVELDNWMFVSGKWQVSDKSKRKLAPVVVSDQRQALAHDIVEIKPGTGNPSDPA